MYTMDTSDDALNKVALVERNTAPQGMTLVDSNAVAKTCKRDLITLAEQIQTADNYVKANACSKLQVIVEQMRFLQKQAESILLEAEQNMKLHHVACNFVKQPGHIYHLYQRESGQHYFSMLSPEEWGMSAPNQTYKGSFRLEQDHSWTPLSQAQKRNTELTIFNKLFSNDAALTTIFGNIS